MNTTQTTTKNVDCTCTCTGDQTIIHTPVRRETSVFVVTTWVCDHCAGQVFAEWALKAA